MATPLWRNATIYQIYPRSFCDSNGDGIGDIPGIISKLDYLHDLGVKIVWLSPIYASPLDDLGYDISDYYKIHPDYGTMEDFEALVKEADKRGLKIVMDLVVNHTSDEHEWFRQSKDRNSPYHDYYYWRKGKEDNKLPPNNWTSMFTGPAWEYVPEVDEWYLHLYSKKQPDLNYHNPAVIEEVEKILRFYLDKGVYGFRCDVINQIFKETLEDGKGKSEQARGIEHYLMKEGNHKILQKFYEDVFSKQECVVIGETYNVDRENGIRFLKDHEMDMFFQFEVMGVDQTPSRVFAKKFKAESFKQLIYKWQKDIDWNANYLENHDQRRSITRFGDENRYHDESGKALGLLNLTLRGTPFVYEGEEIGMIDKKMGEPEDSKDVAVVTVNKIVKGYHLPRWFRRSLCNRLDRDHARTPMQWSNGVSAGFSSNKDTWIPVNPKQLDKINVEAESKDPSSVLCFYKEMIHLRETLPSLYDGSFVEVPTKGNLIAYKREKGEEVCFVVINLGKKPLSLASGFIPKGASVLISTYMDKKLPSFSLRPYEGVLLKVK
ncbi:MAG: alpha-glucosidase [Bacilli bacterium]|nr:alpha-glucosidase [Bacilli bacterium]